MLKKTFFLGLVLAFLLTPQTASSLPERIPIAIANITEKPLVCLLVNSTIYADIESSLDQYVVDVENSGFYVKTIETNQLLDETPEGIRAYLQENLPLKLAGCLLVGDIPGARFEIRDEEFPVDLYYMDLDGIWTDSDNDLIYDGRSGDVVPEIWVGRLKVPDIEGNEASLMNHYFDKNHRYRTGTLDLPWWRGMIYIDDGGTNTNTLNNARSSLSKICSDIISVEDRATTNATDYKTRLNDPTGYQWVYLMCHGTANNHTFMVPPSELETPQGSWFQWDGTVYSSDYRSIDPRVSFYHFVMCSAAKYTEPDYIAGSAVFGNDYGLLAVGSTQTVSTLPINDFYEPLSEGKSIGEAFHEWFVQLHERYNYLQREFCGLTIIGDPTLQIYHEVHDVAVTNLTVSLTNASGEETLTVDVALENQGDFNETFDVAIYYDLTNFDSSDVTLAAKTETTVTFNLGQSDKLILGYHTLEAKASTIPGELDRKDNTLLMPFKGRIVNSPVTLGKPVLSMLIQVMAALSLFVGCGISALFFLKILMAERLPLISSILRKLR